MPEKRRTDKRRSRRLSGDEYMTLALGPSIDAPAFASEDDARAAWEGVRDKIMADGWLSPGKRPWAFWHFDAPDVLENAHSESEACWRIGAASEKTAIEAQWRQHIAVARNSHPHDARAARLMALEWGEVPGWFLDREAVALAPRRRG